MSISQRVTQIIEIIEHGRQKVFAEKAGVAQSSISRAIHRDSEFRTDTIRSILLAYPNIDARWLITGEGNMYVKDESHKIENNFNNVKDKSSVYSSDAPKSAPDALSSATVNNLNRLIEMLQRDIQELREQYESERNQ